MYLAASRPFSLLRRFHVALVFLCLFLLLAALGCDTVAPKPYTRQVVVESYQMAGQPMRKVRLMRTTSTSKAFDASKQSLQGAAVQIELLNPDGTTAARYPFQESASKQGVYLPIKRPTVKPRRTYRLRVTPPGSDKTITARTVVPDTFSLAAENPDTVQYNRTEHLSFRVTPSSYPDRPTIYQFYTWALDASAEQLTPAGKQLVKGTEALWTGGVNYSPQNITHTNWPLVNESQYHHRSDGTIDVTYSWKGILFYGAVKIHTHAIDDNLYDLIRSEKAQQASASPGQILNVIDHVDGGTGIFGSMARATYTVYVER